MYAVLEKFGRHEALSLEKPVCCENACCAIRLKIVKVQFLSYSYQNIFRLTLAISYGG